MPRPVSRWWSAARPLWWRPAVSIRTSRWWSSSIRLSGTIRSWKDRGPARLEAGTNSFARRVAISRTWTTSGSTSTPRRTRDPAQRRGLVFRLVPGNIWVNQQGRRFHNEARLGGNSATPALTAQSPRHAWAIMDTPMTAPMEVADPYYRDGDKVVRARVVELLNNSPFIRKADTLAELARRI